MTPPSRSGGRVAVVTGGGAGIGAAIAAELGRQDFHVVTVDPLVSVDGSDQAPDPEPTTAERIVAAGGSARASAASVTDAAAVRELFDGLAAEFGGLDAVVNVAGITRPTGFARGTGDDWHAVLSVHLDGYLNVLAAALPIMAASGFGHVLGVTSGSGWRPADTGAYGCAKRAVASLTWQLGRALPPGVVLNAISPIAMTRMVTAAMQRSRRSGATATAGLSLSAMPMPEELGPLAAHLVADGFDACRGRVVFTAGTEVAVVDPPRLLEAFPVDPPGGLGRALDALTEIALGPAERAQQSGGGSNARFGAVFGDGDVDAAATPTEHAVRICDVVSDHPAVADAAVAALEARGVRCSRRDPADGIPTWGDDAPDAVVVALAGAAPASPADGWAGILEEHAGIVGGIEADAVWARAVADGSGRTDRPIRLVTVVDAATAGGRSRAQAAAQLARSAPGATGDRVGAFAVAVESADPASLGPLGDLVGHLVCSPSAPALSGAELVLSAGTVGLRSHPRVGASVAFAGTAVPPWFDGVLGEVTR